ncbi:MAG: ATP-binding protein [Verrucomicrobiota bacterium]
MPNDFASNLDNDWTMKDALRKCASSAVVVVDALKNLTQITPEAASLLEIQPETVLNKNFGSLTKELREVFEQTFASAQSVSAEIKLFRDGGGELDLLIKATPTFGSDGKISGAIAVLTDLNGVEKFESHLARIDRLASIGSLSASMAHEIKNAMVAVKTFMDLLLMQNQTDELAGIVGREMTRIDSIVSQILRFSGPAKPVLAPLHVHDVLNHSLQLVQHQLTQKNIKLQTALGATPGVVKGDDYQLKQAFLNLLFNAIEATPTDGNIQVITELIEQTPLAGGELREANPTQLRVTILDDGVGIAPENLSRVFDPFFTTKPKGTGLGLAITRRIIQEHRGTITVESQPGKGAAFRVAFPIPGKG